MQTASETRHEADGALVQSVHDSGDTNSSDNLPEFRKAFAFQAQAAVCSRQTQ